MADLPFELRYQLTRRQRLVPHLQIWGPLALIVPAGLVVLLAAVVQVWWAAFLALAWSWLFRNFLYRVSLGGYRF
jgi:hypothetical protein